MLEVISLIGPVTPPYEGYSGEAAGLIVFLSNIIKLITAVGGLLLFLNLVFAGLKYIMSGSDPKTIQEAGSSITNSIIGLVIIAASFIIISIISLVFFGKADYILNPTISGPEQSPSQVILNVNETDCKPKYDGVWKNGACYRKDL